MQSNWRKSITDPTWVSRWPSIKATPCNHTQGMAREQIWSFRTPLPLLRHAWRDNGTDWTFFQRTITCITSPSKKGTHGNSIQLAYRLRMMYLESSACQPILRNTSPSATSAWPTPAHKATNHASTTWSRGETLAQFGADLCEFNNRTLLIICGYYSKYIEAARLNDIA